MEDRLSREICTLYKTLRKDSRCEQAASLSILEVKRYDRVSRKEIRFFFTLFGLTGCLSKGEIVIDDEEVSKLKALLAILLVRYKVLEVTNITVNGVSRKMRIISINAMSLFEDIIDFWIRSFGNGRYRVPDSNDFKILQEHCHGMGVRTSFGVRFADGFKAYVACVANQLFVSDDSIRAFFLSEKVFPKRTNLSEVPNQHVDLVTGHDAHPEVDTKGCDINTAPSGVDPTGGSL